MFMGPILDSDPTPATLGELLGALPDGAHVLDLGCGAGSWPYDVTPQFAIAALDMYSTAPRPFPPHVTYAQGTAEALPYPDQCFDLIIANFVMEHVHDFDTAITEAARVAKPDGIFYMSVPNANSIEDTLYRALNAEQRLPSDVHRQRFSFESVLATMYARTPFKLVSYLEWPAGFVYLRDTAAIYAAVAALLDAAHDATGVDMGARSNYIFVFQRGGGIGRRTVYGVCTHCGSGTLDPTMAGPTWTCTTCGHVNQRAGAGTG